MGALREAYAAMARARDTTVQTNATCLVVRRGVESGEMPESDLTDVGFALREAAAMLDAARKELTKQYDAVGEQLCLKIVKRIQSGAHGKEDPVARGELATATPEPGVEVVLPKSGTPEYAALLATLGVADPGGVTRVHWPSVCAHVARRLEQGIDTAGLPAQHAVFKCTFRRRNKRAGDAGEGQGADGE